MFEHVLPVAVVTVDGGGVELVPVMVGGSGDVVDRRSGVPLDLVSLVTVLGGDLLVPCAA